ncbi:MAG: beta-lactamase family protein [Clostridia bacterium]|nr:beta-lactamase family protein [Clostridia bacterium]
MSLSEKITRCLSTAVENNEAAGISVLIRKNGEDLCYTSAGYADIATGKPIRRDSIFRLYSQSKPITAAAVMILVDRGLLDLQDPVEKYLPGFRNPQVLLGDGTTANAVRPPWILDLLGMTAGLCYPAEDAPGQFAARVFEEDQEKIRNGEGLDTVSFCNRLGELPLAFHPGRGWRYSTCADVLGAVVEVVSGKRFGQFLKDEIFDPLGMKDTAFWVPEDKWDRLVTCYEPAGGKLWEYNSLHLAVGQYNRDPAFESGGAGLVSTLDDYAVFAEMLMNHGTGGEQRILSPAAVEYMTSPQLLGNLPLSMWDGLQGYSYSCLMRICEQPGACSIFAEKGEYGWDGWLGTYFTILPKEGIVFQLYQNTTGAGLSPVARRCRNLLASELG